MRYGPARSGTWANLRSAPANQAKRLRDRWPQQGAYRSGHGRCQVKYLRLGRAMPRDTADAGWLSNTDSDDGCHADGRFGNVARGRDGERGTHRKPAADDETQPKASKTVQGIADPA